MTTVDRRVRTLPWVALGVVYVLWGSTYLANRFLIVSMPPLLASGTRFLSGGLLLGLLVLLFAGRRALALTRAQLGTAALSGLLLPAWGNGLVIVAQSQVASGLAALLIASVPLYIAVFRAVTGDRPRPATAVGVLLGAVGLALLAVPGTTALVVGTILGFGLGWSWPGLMQFAVVRINPTAPAAATAIVQMGVYAGGFGGPIAFGFVAARTSFPTAWTAAAVTMVAAALLVVLGRRLLLAHRDAHAMDVSR